MSQALHLANGATINDKLRAENSAVARAIASKTTDNAVIDHLFRAALTREPTPSERTRLLKILNDAVGNEKDPKAIATLRRQAIEDLYWATLTGNEFLFNH